MKDLLTEKSRTLFKAVEESPALTAALSRWTEIWLTVEKYNNDISTINEKIDRLRSDAELENYTEAKRELARLKQIELRYRDNIVSCCESRDMIGKELADLNEQLENQRKRNTVEIERTFAEYGSSLDMYLNTFGANFQVEDLIQTRVGGVLRAHYEIGLLGETIPLGTSKRIFRNAHLETY